MQELLYPFIHPYTWLLLVMGVGILWLGRRAESPWCWRLTALAFLALLAFSTPYGARQFAWLFERHWTPVSERPPDCQAIVILSADVRLVSKKDGTTVLGAESMYRCQHGAALYRSGAPCPVYVTGGKPSAGRAGLPPAPLMRDYLITLGVDDVDIVVEDQSRDTRENAIHTAKFLRTNGIKKIALVTDAVHMYRALFCFHREGVDLTPAPSHFRPGEYEFSVYDLVPTEEGMVSSQRVFREVIGLTWYWWHGYL